MPGFRFIESSITSELMVEMDMKATYQKNFKELMEFKECIQKGRPSKVF